MEDMVRELVKQRIDGLDIEDMAENAVRGIVRDQVEKAIPPVISSQINAIIGGEIEKVFSTEVTTDDGWGKKQVYSSFEELFKFEFKKRLNDQYQIKAVLEKLVRERVSSLISQDYAKVVETIVDTLTASKLVKK